MPALLTRQSHSLFELVKVGLLHLWGDDPCFDRSRLSSGCFCWSKKAAGGGSRTPRVLVVLVQHDISYQMDAILASWAFHCYAVLHDTASFPFAILHNAIETPSHDKARLGHEVVLPLLQDCIVQNLLDLYATHYVWYCV